MPNLHFAKLLLINDIPARYGLYDTGMNLWLQCFCHQASLLHKGPIFHVGVYNSVIWNDRCQVDDILRYELCFLQTRVQQQNCLSDALTGPKKCLQSSEKSTMIICNLVLNFCKIEIRHTLKMKNLLFWFFLFKQELFDR